MSAKHRGELPRAEAKTKTWCHTLKHQGGPALRQNFEQLDTTAWGVERLETHRVELQYFRNHEHRMDYPRYLASGWQIGSGPVESSCKRAVTQRLKGAGVSAEATPSATSTPSSSAKPPNGPDSGPGTPNHSTYKTDACPFPGGPDGQSLIAIALRLNQNQRIVSLNSTRMS